MMDRISQLPDDLLLKISSSLLPKDVVSTMLLSKRWKPLWRKVPILVFDESQKLDYRKFSRFVDRYLIMHEASGLKILKFRLGKNCGKEDIQLWITAANRCSVEKLIIVIDRSSNPPEAILPRSLYTDCSMLVELRLNNLILEDFSSPPSFPVLEILELDSVKYPSDEFVKRFLSSCPALKYLLVVHFLDNNVKIFTVRVPSLNYLRVENRGWNRALAFVIDCPSLEELNIRDQTTGRFYVIENDMPHIVKANIDTTCRHPWKMIRSITSVQRLCLCIATSMDPYPIGTIFCNLLHIEIGTCENVWLNLLMHVLNDSPKLRTIKLYDQCHNQPSQKLRPYWIEPSSIPKCLLWSLETLEWAGYEGTKEKEELVAFILRSGSCLKKVTISSNTTDPKKKLEMIKRLSLSFRRSPACALVFN